MLQQNLIADLNKEYALRIIKLGHYLQEKHGIDYALQAMLQQLMRSGTSIGANVFESKNAQSRPDFVTKLTIALKEADES